MDIAAKIDEPILTFSNGTIQWKQYVLDADSKVIAQQTFPFDAGHAGTNKAVDSFFSLVESKGGDIDASYRSARYDIKRVVDRLAESISNSRSSAEVSSASTRLTRAIDLMRTIESHYWNMFARASA